MLVDIDKIIVGDRIRKDFGDIQELADDIRENGLINPPVVNKEYVLLAGERRLRACKLLGWPQIEVRMMDTRDAEHELNIEISENDVRKGFTKSERVDYIKRLLRIEQAKAKERQTSGTSVENSTQVGRSDEITAAAFGMKKDTMRRELFIADNADFLDPADFADWDEGKLSTNKAFQKIKAAQAQAEHDRKIAEMERDAAKSELADAYQASELLETEIAALKRQVAEKPKPQVVEREVVREVAPPDYDSTKKRVNDLKRDNERLTREYQDMLRKKQEVDRQLNQANELLGEKSRIRDANRDIEQFTAAVNAFVRQYAGKALALDQFGRVDAATQDEFRKAVTNMAAFAQNILQMVEESE